MYKLVAVSDSKAMAFQKLGQSRLIVRKLELTQSHHMRLQVDQIDLQRSVRSLIEKILSAWKTWLPSSLLSRVSTLFGSQCFDNKTTCKTAKLRAHWKSLCPTCHQIPLKIIIPWKPNSCISSRILPAIANSFEWACRSRAGEPPPGQSRAGREERAPPTGRQGARVGRQNRGRVGRYGGRGGGPILRGP